MSGPCFREIHEALAEPIPGVRRAIAAQLRQKYFPDDLEGWRMFLTQALAPYGPVLLTKLAESEWDLGRLDPCKIWCAPT